MARLACAIYTRKSSDEGLEQDFNSLDAQREACTAYILSQKHEGWYALPEQYDDGGYSGGNMERPSLARLLADIATGRIQVVVVYKVDRLTRSLTDFAKIVERFDAKGVSFVSVTQHFNTTSSMGRLTLNVLLSFAQFEREVTGERIRDKIAASKRKGMWMGGNSPVGYLAHERTLVVDEPHAQRVREFFRLYLEFGCVRKLKAELDRRGWLTPGRRSRRDKEYGGRPFSRGQLYKLLGNPVYIGKISHKGKIYPGQHPAIVDQELWDQVNETIASNRKARRNRVTAKFPSPLAGLVFDWRGEALTPTHGAKGNRHYRYYVSRSLIGKLREDDPDGLRIPAQELEDAVRHGLQDYLREPSRLLDNHPEIDAAGCHDLIESAKKDADTLEHGSTHERIELFARLVERVIVSPDKLEIRLNPHSCGPTGSGVPVVIAMPACFRRSGLGVRLIIQGTAPSRPGVVDPRLVQIVNRGVSWFRQMVGKDPMGTGAIAGTAGVASSYVVRITYLAFLAPDIVGAIQSGRHPPLLTADRLVSSVPLPLCWKEQRRQLGFPPPSI